MLSAELVNYMNNSLANRLKREQEKQMESSKQEAEDRSRSGLKQTAAAIIEPNVIDIDAALAQMGEQKDRRSEKQTEAERKKEREADSKKKNMQESDPARERITAKSKKTMHYLTSCCRESVQPDRYRYKQQKKQHILYPK